MFDRYERPVRIICLALAAWLVWQLGGLILSGDPLAHLKIPALPTLPGATNEPAKTSTNGTNGTNGTNAMAKTTNAPAAGKTRPTGPTEAGSRKSGPPKGMPGERGAASLNKMELPPEAKARVDRIIDSEIFGPIIHPMPMALIGIADQEAFIQATNGQTEPVKVGGEMGGIKLLRIGINRVLVEQDGEKKELTLFDGIGGESLLPKSTNEPSTNAPAKETSKQKAAAGNISTNKALSSQQKETP